MITQGREASWKYMAGEPDCQTVIVDNTNLTLIQNSDPSSAHGSSKDLYTWLELRWRYFPDPLKKALLQECDAVLHSYTRKGQSILVIHVTNPDFRERADATCTEVAKKLTQAYLNILNIFHNTKKQHLRLQPVAGGLYAGCFLATLPTLTVAAMKSAFKLLPLETQEALVSTNIELCVSYEGEHKLYVNAFRSFIDKPFKEHTQTAQEQHRLQQQRGSKRSQRLAQLQQRRLQRQAQTTPTPMTSTTTTTPASITTPTSTPTYSNNLTQSWH